MFDDVPLEHEYHNLGNDFYRLGQYEKAVDHYAKALELNPALTETYFNRALAYARLGDYESALADASHVIDLDGSLHDAYYLRGRIWELSLNDKAAVADYEQALRLNPSFATASDQLRLIKARQWIYDELRQVRGQIELEPCNGYLRFQFGQKLAMIGHHDDAVRALEQARANGFVLADLWVELGQAYVTQGRNIQGMAAFRQAIRMDPTEVAAYAHLGQLLTEAGHHREAVGVFRQAISMPNTDAASLLCGLGMALAGLRRWDEAHRAFQEAMEMSPRLPEAAFGLAVVAWRQGEPDVAFSRCRQVLDTSPQMIPAVVLMVNIAVARGDIATAAETIIAAVRNSPHDERLAYVLWTLSAYTTRSFTYPASDTWRAHQPLVDAASRVVRDRVTTRNELLAVQRDLSDALLAACPLADEAAALMYQKLMARPRAVLSVLYEELRRPGIVRPVERLHRTAALAQKHEQGWLGDVCTAYAVLLSSSPEAPRLEVVLRTLGRLAPLGVNHAESLLEMYRIASDGLAADSIEGMLALRPRIERLAVAIAHPGFIVPEMPALLVDLCNWLDRVDQAANEDVADEWSCITDAGLDLRNRFAHGISAPEQWILGAMLTHFGAIARQQVTV